MINPYQPIAGAGAVTAQPSPLAQGMGNAALSVGQPAMQPQMPGGQTAPGSTQGGGGSAQQPMTPQQQLAAAIMKSGQGSQNAGALGLNLAADAVAQNSPHYGQQVAQALGGLFGIGQSQNPNQGGAGWGADTDPSNGYYGSGYGSGWGG